MSKRIKSSNVQLGESFIVEHSLKLTPVGNFNDDELSNEELSLQGKEREFKQKCDQMLIDAQNKANSIIEEANNKAAQMLEESKQYAAKQKEELEVLKNNTLEEARQEGIQTGFNEG